MREDDTRANRPADDGPVGRDALMSLAIASLTEARDALRKHYIDWDGEPEDGWALRLAWAKCDQTLSVLTENTALRAQSDAEVEREAWCPIETAPKDGTPIILFARARNATAQIPVIGWWIDGEWIEQAFSPNVPVKLTDATAWMPRPEFPRGEHRKDGV